MTMSNKMKLRVVRRLLCQPSHIALRITQRLLADVMREIIYR